MRARIVLAWMALMLVQAIGVAASRTDDSLPAPLFSTPTPTPETARSLSPQEERLLRQLDILFERGARAAAQGKLALACSCFQQVLSASLSGQAAPKDSLIGAYRGYAAKALEVINARGDEILRLAQQHQMEKRYTEAVLVYELLVEEFRNAAVGRVAQEHLRELLNDPQAGPQILLKRARQCEQKGDLWGAWEAFGDLVARFPESTQARQASVRLEEMRRSGLLTGSLPPQEAREARKLLMIAEIRRLNPHVSLKLEPAEDLYRAVIARYPDTLYAAEAKARLKEMEEKR